MNIRWLLRLALKIVVAVAGASIVIIGLILIPFPGPGLLIVLGGLIILGTEFAWAKRYVTLIKQRLAKLKDRVHRQMTDHK